MAEDFLLSREDILGGLPARRASTILIAIENRTAYLASRARLAGLRYVPDQSFRSTRRFKNWSVMPPNGHPWFLMMLKCGLRSLR